MFKKFLSFFLCICITLITLFALGMIELNRAFHASPKFFVCLGVIALILLLLRPRKEDPRYVAKYGKSPYLDRLREATQNIPEENSGKSFITAWGSVLHEKVAGIRDDQEKHLDNLRAGKDKGDV